MSILDRTLLIILALGSLVASVFAFLLGIGVFDDNSVSAVLPFSTYPYNVYTIVIAIVFALVALRFVFYRWNSPDPEYVVLQGDHGQIRISFETIKQLANRTGRSIRGVQEFDTRVRNGQAGIWLSVRVKALPDLDLSRVSAEIQTAVKEYVEHTTGINVEKVIVNIAELAGSPAKSAKTWVE
ncbi:alkaline shock response membrane anchor protein AmaP [Alicyclobacillus pomorum]|uniref:alkaline shock response membrane anchor protein AmaP n=1 Tax=Alicyclobacillus pomorum TaxID=204470 RepID=UPI00041AC2FC|nr:alkaline shock response membrane anchor protein AmaP [Alicyclobacillus pomorum]